MLEYIHCQPEMNHLSQCSHSDWGHGYCSPDSRVFLSCYNHTGKLTSIHFRVFHLMKFAVTLAGWALPDEQIATFTHSSDILPVVSMLILHVG